MSCRNQEKGEFVLPSRAFNSFRKAMVDVANAEREKVMAAAVALHAYITKPIDQGKDKAPRRERLAALNKALKEKNASRAVDGVFEEAFNSIDGELWRRNHYGPQVKWDFRTRHKAALLVLPWNNDGPRKFQAPKKKDLPVIAANETSFDGGVCSVHFNAETRTVHWDVEEGNHNVEEAHESALGKAFFQQLNKVEWTRGTGGHIRYSDEYAEEAAMDHGGNPISTRFHMGPLGKQQMETEWGAPVFSRASKARARR